MRLSEETIDGLMLEWALSRDTTLQQRRKIFYAKVAQDRAAIASKTKAELIDALKKHDPNYIVELLEKHTIRQLQDRVVFTLQSSGTQYLRDLLEIKSPE